MNTRLKAFLKGAGSILEIFPNKIKNFSLVPSNNDDKSINKYFDAVEKRMKTVVINEAPYRK